MKILKELSTGKQKSCRLTHAFVSFGSTFRVVWRTGIFCMLLNKLSKKAVFFVANHSFNHSLNQLRAAFRKNQKIENRIIWISKMKNTNKLLSATKEYFCLESEKDLANFFGIDLCELEKIRVGKQNLSIENKLTILNYMDGLDENNLYIFDKLKTDHLLNEICLLYSLNADEFIEASQDASLLRL